LGFLASQIAGLANAATLAGSSLNSETRQATVRRPHPSVCFLAIQGQSDTVPRTRTIVLIDPMITALRIYSHQLFERCARPRSERRSRSGSVEELIPELITYTRPRADIAQR